MSLFRNETKKSRKPWSVSRQSQPSNENLDNLKKIPSNAEQKFKEAQQKLQDAVQKHITSYDSSSDEEDIQTDVVLGSILKKYKETGGKDEQTGRTQEYLEENWLSGAPTCLICICKVKRNDNIWNCVACYCTFHLVCIQRWSKDTIVQKKLNLEQQIQTRRVKLQWDCPKCRHNYNPEGIPESYKCYCQKTENPKYQAYLPPHSCGEVCGKKLKPDCGHSCLLLCHPGPCPPCPKTIKAPCYCGSKAPRLQRCSRKDWSCGDQCGKPLSCGKHSCTQPCHTGDCHPCPKKSVQRCLCRAVQKLRDCSEPFWQCDKVCGKLLDCKNHVCEQKCHPENCGPCVLTQPRTCPCGKSSYELPCTEDTPTCGDTCGKLLECGEHVCYQRCHKDKCGPCLETVTKSCRCGLHSKEVQCKKQYFCDTKCKRMKDCNKHPCNRKCCDGNCPPCEKPCGKTLSCGNHKCKSVCHRGPCYPCNQTERVTCRCGETAIVVPCGRKHKTKPPKCLNACKLPPDCHHERRDFHHCHFGDCPPCRQVCEKIRDNCSHSCRAPCHSSVLVKLEVRKAASMPWEQKEPQRERQALPCPRCVVAVPITCFGQHETSNWPCHLAKPTGCHRECGRVLMCGNHSCSLLCHTVEGAENDVKAGVNCEVCDKPCSKPRPTDCQHVCPLRCHPDECPPCKQTVRVKCHCGLTQLYIACTDWTTPEKREQLLNCGNQCPQNYDCGHRCRLNCHSGPCLNVDGCKKKVKLHCPCKRIKKEFPCEMVRNGVASVQCDEGCVQKIEEERMRHAVMQEKLKLEDEMKNKQELEKYEKIFQQRKKNREKKTSKLGHKRPFFDKYKYWMCILVMWVAVMWVVFMM